MENKSKSSFGSNSFRNGNLAFIYKNNPIEYPLLTKINEIL